MRRLPRRQGRTPGLRLGRDLRRAAARRGAHLRADLDKGFRPCDIMILVRGATDGAKVAAELLDFKRRNNDPRYRFDVMTQEALIVGNAPVSSFIAAALRLALNPDDSLSARRLQPLPRPRRSTGRCPTIRNATFFRSVRLLSPEEAFERIVMRHALQGDQVGRRPTCRPSTSRSSAFCATKDRRHRAVPPTGGRSRGRNRSLSGRGERHDGRDHHHPQGQGA